MVYKYKYKFSSNGNNLWCFLCFVPDKEIMNVSLVYLPKKHSTDYSDHSLFVFIIHQAPNN